MSKATRRVPTFPRGAFYRSRHLSPFPRGASPCFLVGPIRRYFLPFLLRCLRSKPFFRKRFFVAPIFPCGAFPLSHRSRRLSPVSLQRSCFLVARPHVSLRQVRTLPCGASHLFFAALMFPLSAFPLFPRGASSCFLAAHPLFPCVVIPHFIRAPPPFLRRFPLFPLGIFSCCRPVPGVFGTLFLAPLVYPFPSVHPTKQPCSRSQYDPSRSWLVVD